jgi:hypothetical protein
VAGSSVAAKLVFRLRLVSVFGARFHACEVLHCSHGMWLVWVHCDVDLVEFYHVMFEHVSYLMVSWGDFQVVYAYYGGI